MDTQTSETEYPKHRIVGERLTVVVDDGVSAMLVSLAGSPRKQGAYLSQLIRTAYGGREVAEQGLEYNSLQLTVMGLVGKSKEHDRRLAELEARDLD